MKRVVGWEHLGFELLWLTGSPQCTLEMEGFSEYFFSTLMEGVDTVAIICDTFFWSKLPHFKLVFLPY